MTVETEIINRQNEIPLFSYNDAIVVGVGGIGSWVALDLALSGQVGQLYIIDPDVVESSNLNRTPFRLCDIGNPKVDALKFIILERRIMDITTYKRKTSEALIKELKKELGLNMNMLPISQIHEGGIIIDCRDDVFEDMYDFPYKYYKIGYDGLEVTIDGNPRNTAVWGRANGYRFTPSFICPAQLAANIVVTDVLTKKLTSEEMKNLPSIDTTTNTSPFDVKGRFNKTVTFNCKDLIETIYRESIS